MTGDVQSSKELEDSTIANALSILERRLRTFEVLSSPDDVKNFLRLQAQGLEYEIFSILYLDSKHRLIEYERLFRGTVAHTPVYPREVVKRVLQKNAVSVILHHNHPSGCSRPSVSDRHVTMKIKAALALIDVNVLDHVITSDEGAFSLAADEITAISIN